MVFCYRIANVGAKPFKWLVARTLSLGDGVVRGRGVCVPGETKSLSMSTRTGVRRSVVYESAHTQQTPPTKINETIAKVSSSNNNYYSFRMINDSTATTTTTTWGQPIPKRWKADTLNDVAFHEQEGRIVCSGVGLPMLDAPEPLMVDQLPEFLKIGVVQVLEVPKISQDSIPQRKLLSEPQLVERLVDLPVPEGAILARGKSALGTEWCQVAAPGRGYW